MVYSLVFGIGAFQSFVFAFLLIIKKEKSKADKFLSAFFFIVGLYFFNICSSAFLLWKIFPDQVFVIALVTLTFGPLLYFYVISLIGKKITPIHLLHLVPILGVYLLIQPYFSESYETKILYFIDKFNTLPINISIGLFLEYLSAPIYFIWIIVILKKYKVELKNNYSTIENSSLDWIRKLLYGAITFWMIDSLNVYALNYTNIEYPYILSFYIKAAFMTFIILIGYNGIKQGGVFVIKENEKSHDSTETKVIDEESINALIAHIRDNKDDNEINIQDIAQNLKIPVHVLSYMMNTKAKKEIEDQNIAKAKLIPDEKAEEYKSMLVEFMQQEKGYMNNELRIQDVSISLNIPANYISYVLNQKINQNFYDFVNQHRIDEVKNRLRDSKYKNLTIVAIAFDCGFNSKATFNRLFKQYTGYTPTQFRNLSNS